MVTSMSGSRGMLQNRTGASSGNRSSGSLQLGTDIIPQGYQKGQLQQFTPEQMGLFEQLMGHIGPQSQTSKLAGGDQSAFEQLEAPALRQLGELQGGLASRFSGMGSFGSRRSSGHQLAQGSLASDFAEKLQGQRLGLQRQALQDLFGMGNTLLGQRPYDQFLVEEQKEDLPFWQQLLLGASGGLGQALGSGLTGGIGSGLSALGPIIQKLLSGSRQGQVG